MADDTQHKIPRSALLADLEWSRDLNRGVDRGAARHWRRVAQGALAAWITHRIWSLFSLAVIAAAIVAWWLICRAGWPVARVSEGTGLALDFLGACALTKSVVAGGLSLPYLLDQPYLADYEARDNRREAVVGLLLVALGFAGQFVSNAVN